MSKFTRHEVRLRDYYESAVRKLRERDGIDFTEALKVMIRFYDEHHRAERAADLQCIARSMADANAAIPILRRQVGDAPALKTIDRAITETTRLLTAHR